MLLVTRRGCHLCELAEPVVVEICADRGLKPELVDVDDDEDLRRRFTDHVPVVLVDGRVLDYWAVDAQRLADAVDGRPVTWPPEL